MATNEQERVHQAMRDNARGRGTAEKMVVDLGNGKIRIVGGNDPDRTGMVFGREDLGFSTPGKEARRDYPVCR